MNASTDSATEYSGRIRIGCTFAERVNEDLVRLSTRSGRKYFTLPRELVRHGINSMGLWDINSVCSVRAEEAIGKDII